MRASPVRTVVDEEAPHALERDAAGELAEVDAAVAQRAAVAVGLGDLRGEGDDALEAGVLDVAHAGHDPPAHLTRQR
jgi:hypothetical protein